MQKHSYYVLSRLLSPGVTLIESGDYVDSMSGEGAKERMARELAHSGPNGKKKLNGLW